MALVARLWFFLFHLRLVPDQRGLEVLHVVFAPIHGKSSRVEKAISLHGKMRLHALDSAFELSTAYRALLQVRFSHHGWKVRAAPPGVGTVVRAALGFGQAV